MKRCCPQNWMIAALFVSLTGVVGLSAWADNNAGAKANPYQAIIKRNMFGLTPIPPPPPPKKPNVDASLPKITPNGLMTLFGKLQVLFKVAKPGKSANDEKSYVMSVGDRQDDISVQKIDEQSAMITFDNHGTIQQLALKDAKATTGGPVGGPGDHGGHQPRFTRNHNSGGWHPPSGNQPGNRFAGGASGGQPSSNPGMGGGPGFNSASAKPAKPKITPEEQVLMIEAQRLKYTEQGNKQMANLFPITSETSKTMQGLTPGNGGGSSSGSASAPAPGNP